MLTRTPRLAVVLLALVAVAAAAIVAPAAPAPAVEPLPTLSIDDVVVDPEGDSGTRTAMFTVTLSHASDAEVTVKYATSSGTAVASSDFTAIALTTLAIPAGATSATIAVSVLGDLTDENDETFQVGLSAPTGATIADGTGVATIVDDDPPPALSVNDPSVVEGTGTSRSLVFSVTLSRASGKTVTVDYATADGTAVSTGSPTDYTPRNGTLSFTPGITTLTVTVAVQTDALDELDETLSLVLTLPAGSPATIADGTGQGTIVDDDGPTVAVNDISVAEGDAGTTSATFTLTLSAASVQPVVVKLATSNDGALAGADYTALPSGADVTIASGQTTAAVTVPVVGDVLDEPDERFRLTLSQPSGATISDATGIATIVDDDAPPLLSISDAVVAEGSIGTSSAQLTISLSAPSGRSVVLGYATSDGTATAGVDYGSASETTTIAAGQTQRTISIPIGADGLVENDETFAVTITSVSGATLAKGRAIVTIVDDDLLAGNTPALSVEDAAPVKEGDSGTTPATFTVRLSSVPGRTVAVDYATFDGSATAPADYLPAAGQLVFAPGETSKSVTVAVRGDTASEGSHGFELRLLGAVNATVRDGSGSAVIDDDDVGNGPISVPSSVRASKLFCATRRRCSGLRVRWTVHARGSLVYELVARSERRVTRRTATGKRRRVTRIRMYRILKTTSTISRPRSGRRTLRPTPGRRARRQLAKLRRERARTLRLRVTFVNRASGEERTTTKYVRLKLFR